MSKETPATHPVLVLAKTAEHARLYVRRHRLAEAYRTLIVVGDAAALHGHDRPTVIAVDGCEERRDWPEMLVELEARGARVVNVAPHEAPQ